MKKITFFAVFSILVGTTFAQPVKDRLIDSSAFRNRIGRKTDTVLVPVYYYQRTDTAKLRFVYYKGRNVKTQDGYVLYTGIKDGRGNWVQTPKITLFTHKWKPFKEKLLSANPI